MIAGAVGAVSIGAGGAAMAATSSPSAPSSSPGSAPSSGSAAGSATHQGHGRDKDRDGLAHAIHAEWVTRDAKTGVNTTHDEVRGTVSAVSPTAISVRAADGVSQTYVVTPTTKVHGKADQRGTTGSITQVKVGDTARVAGTGTSTLTATGIADSSH